MSLYGSSVKICGVTCGLVMRGAANGQYLAVFEREHASLERIEEIDWEHPEIEGDSLLPGGYGFEVADIQYSNATRSYTVTLQVGEQYLGDVAGFQAQVDELTDTMAEKDAAIAAQENDLKEKDAVIEARDTTIAAKCVEILNLKEQVRSGQATIDSLDAAYEEGVESNG